MKRGGTGPVCGVAVVWLWETFKGQDKRDFRMTTYEPLVEKLGIRGDADVTKVHISESKDLVKAVRKTCEEVIPDMLFKIGNSFIGMGDYGSSIIRSIELIDQETENNKVLYQKLDEEAQVMSPAVMGRTFVDVNAENATVPNSIKDFGDKVKSYNNDMAQALQHLKDFQSVVLNAIEQHLKPAKMQFFKDNGVLAQHRDLRDGLLNELNSLQKDGAYFTDLQKKPREQRSSRKSVLPDDDDDDEILSDSDDDVEKKKKSRQRQSTTSNRSSRKPTAHKRHGRDGEEEEAEWPDHPERDAGASLDREISHKEDRENASESEAEEEVDKDGRGVRGADRKRKNGEHHRKGPIAAETYHRDRGSSSGGGARGDEGGEGGEKKQRISDVVDLT